MGIEWQQKTVVWTSDIISGADFTYKGVGIVILVWAAGMGRGDLLPFF